MSLKILNISAINLWCTKNLVDTQYFLGNLFFLSSNNPNYKVNYFVDPENSSVEFVFLNTCGFISSSRQEMFDTIQSLLTLNKKIYLIWCWLQYFQKLDNFSKEYFKRKNLLSNKNIFYISWNDLDKITLNQIYNWYRSKNFWDFENLNSVRLYTNIDYWFEYLKIAEWCNNHCSFCIIPKIRWRQKSLTIEQILFEVKNLIENWVKEIILISQDSTRYWIDLYWKPSLLELCEKLDNLEWDFKFRILYLYPDILTLSYLEKFSKFKKFIPYFDIPLQHVSDKLLKSMWRYYDKNKIKNFLTKIKEYFPISYIRTNFIIWFPGESQKDVDELIEFIKKWYFDNIALFEYHDEPLAQSYNLPNKIIDEELKKRFQKVLNIVDKKMPDLAFYKKNMEGFVIDFDERYVIVRPWLFAPEIDPIIKISIDKIKWKIEIWNYVKW